MPTVIDPRAGKTIPLARPPRVSRLYHFDPLLTDSNPDAGRLKRKLLIGSGIAHVVFFILLAVLPSPARSVIEPSLPIAIVFTAAPPKVPEFVPPAPAPKPTPAPKLAPKPKPEPRPEPRAPEPEPAPPPVKVVRELAPAPAPAPAPPKPTPVVRTNVFGGTAEGPPVVTSKTGRTVIAAFGDTVAPASTLPARRGRVAEVGFDANAAESSGGAPRRVTTGSVKSGGFDAKAEGTAPAAAPKRERPVSALDSEVEILSKPKPVYTEEARRLRIEGDVVLRVTFQANGRLVVLGVVAGLGHGLDEAAADAAKKVEFNPARRDGQPVDHTASLRVVFRVA